MIKKVGILTAGGDCPGLNAVIRAIVKTAETNGVECYGFVEGYKGLLKNEYIKLDSATTASGILHKGGSIIGSSTNANVFHYKTINENGEVDITIIIFLIYQKCQFYLIKSLKYRSSCLTKGLKYRTI